MPVIKHEELLSLHYQIEKSDVEQKKLEGLLNEKKKDLRKSRLFNLMLMLLCSLLLISTIASIIYIVYWSDDEEGMQQQIGVMRRSEEGARDSGTATSQSQLKALQREVQQLTIDTTELRKLQDLYLYRELVDKEVVYSVQIQAFTDDRIASISQQFVNGRFYSDASYHKFSLGIFATLREAQQFRKALIRSGVLEKKIFVISYQDGKRLRIENPF